MDELDDEQHMPEGVESAVWQRLVQSRRQKVESEQQVLRLFTVYLSNNFVVLNVVMNRITHFLTDSLKNLSVIV